MPARRATARGGVGGAKARAGAEPKLRAWAARRARTRASAVLSVAPRM